MGNQLSAGYVNELLTQGVVSACYYWVHPDSHVARPDCQGLAVVRYGAIALCAECDLRRSAVGKGTAPIRLPDPHALVEIAVTQDALGQAQAALANAVAAARNEGHSWSAVGSVLGTSRQGAQQYFARTLAGTRKAS